MNDAIVQKILGAAITIGVVLGFKENPLWFWLTAVSAAIMVQSVFTGFCPVHFLLEKVTRKPL